MNKWVAIKCFSVLMVVFFLAGCAEVGKDQPSSVKSYLAQSSLDTDSTNAQSDMDRIEKEATEIKKEYKELDKALEVALDGGVIEFDEQIYFESKEGQAYCAGGSGKKTQDIELLQKTYPELQLDEKMFSYSFCEATIYMSDSLEYRKIDAIPQGKKISEIYKAELKKEFITAGFFQYKNEESKFEVSFCLNGSDSLMMFEYLKATQDVKDSYGTKIEADKNYTTSWSDDKYTYFLKADSQEGLNKLVELKISNKFIV